MGDQGSSLAGVYFDPIQYVALGYLPDGSVLTSELRLEGTP